MWFEQAREPVFECFVPDLDPQKWNLIIAKIEVEFVHEIYYGRQVEIRTHLLKIGNSSMLIGQEAHQSGTLCARGRCTMVHYDYELRQSVPIPDPIRERLEAHLVETASSARPGIRGDRSAHGE